MSEIKVDTLTGKTTANDITVTVGASATMSLEQGLAKAWLNYNHTTNTVRDSFGISTMTDVSSGIATANWSNNFNTANYAPLVMGDADPASHYSSSATRSTTNGSNAVFTTSAHQYLMHNLGASVLDSFYVTAQYCGDLA